MEEVELINQQVLKNNINTIHQLGHGYLEGYYYKKLNWNDYYNLFDNLYTKYPDEIDILTKQTHQNDILDVGCNNKTHATYYIDPFVTINDENKIKLDYKDLVDYKFKLITLKNSINYLNEKEILTLISSLEKGGVLIANSFNFPPDFRLKNNEAVFFENGVINHFLIENEKSVYHHTFNATNFELVKKLGFEINYYGKNSVLLKYTKN
jgi:SAM-dependent methyltransferase